jgi:hypothetical protein
MASPPPSITAALQQLPVQAMLLTDQEGVILLQAAGGDSSKSDEHQAMLQRMAVTFAQTTERANKLGLGRNRHVTAFYGERPSAQIAARTLLSSIHPTLTERAVIVHISCAPLILTLMADGATNVGLLLDAAPGLVRALEPFRKSVAGSGGQ